MIFASRVFVETESDRFFEGVARRRYFAFRSQSIAETEQGKAHFETWKIFGESSRDLIAKRIEYLLAGSNHAKR